MIEIGNKAELEHLVGELLADLLESNEKINRVLALVNKNNKVIIERFENHDHVIGTQAQMALNHETIITNILERQKALIETVMGKIDSEELNAHLENLKKDTQQTAEGYQCPDCSHDRAQRQN